MSKKFQTEASIEAAIAQGRGQGHGKDYSPWLEIHNVPSLGKSTRIKGWKTGRIHHLLSQLELQYMFLSDWRDDITDIREQFPLLPREDVQEICKGLGITHPKDPHTGIPIVMTTDFVLTGKDGKEHARTVKPARELEAVRGIEKLEIERVYWESRGATWKIITENELPIDMTKSIEWLHNKKFIGDLAPITDQTIRRAQIFMETRLANGFQVKLADMCSKCDDDLGLASGESLSIARHLLANKVWLTALRPRIGAHKPITITINENYDKQSARMG